MAERWQAKARYDDALDKRKWRWRTRAGRRMALLSWLQRAVGRKYFDGAGKKRPACLSAMDGRTGRLLVTYWHVVCVRAGQDSMYGRVGDGGGCRRTGCRSSGLLSPSPWLVPLCLSFAHPIVFDHFAVLLACGCEPKRDTSRAHTESERERESASWELGYLKQGEVSTASTQATCRRRMAVAAGMVGMGNGMG